MSARKFLLGGEWVEGEGTFEVRSPWDDKLVAEVAEPTEAQVTLALDLAAGAFQITRCQSAKERAQILERVGEGIGQRDDEFVELLIREAGKPRKAAEVEVERAQDTFAFAAREALLQSGEVLAMEASAPGAGHRGTVERFPIGVILGITPFNFPLNLVAHKVAPCLATGNSMVLKPALKTPLCALLLGEVLLEAGMTPGQVNVVPFHHRFVEGLLADERVRMTTFTGSDKVGWDLKGKAVKQRVTLELGGNAAVIVQADSAWRAAVPMIAQAAFGFAGQSCISVQRILVQVGIYEDFRKALLTCIREKMVTGDPASGETVVGPVIDDAARDRILEWVKEAEAAGAKRLTPASVKGRCIEPVLLEDVPADAKVNSGEVFGPVAVLTPYADFEEAIALANASRYGLQAGLFTRDLDLARRAFETLEVGGVMINQVPTFRVENMPYGGVKDSGFGREGLRYAMEEMTELRSMITRLD